MKHETGGDNLGRRMIESIMCDFKELRQELEMTWIKIPLLTEEDEKNFKNAKECMFCNINFDEERNGKKITKIRHHRWSEKVEYDSNGKLIKSNLIGPSCCSCNFLLSEKQQSLPCFALNSGCYDVKYVIDGITNQETNIISKQG